MIDTSFLDGLARFNLIIRKRVTSNYSGPRKSMAQGRGIIFSDHRIYAPGDDFRAIDWKVYARTDDLMIKNYEEERNLIVHIIVDKSLSMGFGNPSKFDYAAMLGVGYAYLALKNNDKFQFAAFSDDIEAYQPQRGLSQLMSMVDYLNKIKLSGKTDILSIAEKYRKHIGSRALVVLISDFLAPIENIKEALYYFSGHEVNVIQVLDAAERNPELEGDFRLKDSETSSQMRTYFSPMSRNEYMERLEGHTAQLEHECNILDMNFFQVTTDMPIFDAFYRVLR
ncbi:MAG: DUF58 domain-containing protein [Nanoarchaeota archaeon]|nr:DUF58 domain-containing protein [Nanoarchaeota archaeon]